MRKAKYPLESLREVREAKVDDATAALGTAVTAREAAELERAGAAALRVEQQIAAEEQRVRERRALDEGQLTVLDLARKEAWEFGVSGQAAKLVLAEEQAKSRQDEARLAEVYARDALAAKKADADVVAKDKARFVEQQQKRALSHEEEMAEEAWRPKRA